MTCLRSHSQVDKNGGFGGVQRRPSPPLAGVWGCPPASFSSPSPLARDLFQKSGGYKEPWFLDGGLGVSPKLKTYGVGGWEDRHLPFGRLLEQSPWKEVGKAEGSVCLIGGDGRTQMWAGSVCLVIGRVSVQG